MKSWNPVVEDQSIHLQKKLSWISILGHHGGRRKVASLRPPFSTPLRSLGEPDPDTPFLVPIEHAPPLFVRIWEDKISLKIPPPPLLGFVLGVLPQHYFPMDVSTEIFPTRAFQMGVSGVHAGVWGVLTENFHSSKLMGLYGAARDVPPLFLI